VTEPVIGLVDGLVRYWRLTFGADKLSGFGLVMSGVILGRDPSTGAMPESLDAQCANMFAHMKATVEAAGGSTDDIIKMTVWLKDRTQRGPVNVEWLKMFPDEHSRPARHALPMDNMDGGALVQCDFTAMID